MIPADEQDQLIERLARLDVRDRAWLLAELSPPLRRELAGMLAEDEASAALPQSSVPETQWESLPPEHVAAALEREPAWLVSSATRATDTRWREKLLAAMQARRRQEIQHADRSGRPLAARAARSVLTAVGARIAAGQTQAVVPRSKFAALVDQMRSRLA